MGWFPFSPSHPFARSHGASLSLYPSIHLLLLFRTGGPSDDGVASRSDPCSHRYDVWNGNRWKREGRDPREDHDVVVGGWTWTCVMADNQADGNEVEMEENGCEASRTTYAVRALHTGLRKHRSYDVARFAEPPPDWTRCEGERHVRRDGNGVKTVSCGSGTSLRRWRGVPERVGAGTTAHYALVMQGEDVVALPLETWYTYRHAPSHVGDRPSTLEEAESAMQARHLVRGNVLPKLRQQSEQAQSTQVHGGGLRWNQATDRDHEADSDPDGGGQEESEEDGRAERIQHGNHASRQGSRADGYHDPRRRGDVDVDATKDKPRERRETSEDMEDNERSDASEDGLEENEEDEEGGKEDWEFEENATDDEEEQKDVRAPASKPSARTMPASFDPGTLTPNTPLERPGGQGRGAGGSTEGRPRSLQAASARLGRIGKEAPRSDRQAQQHVRRRIHGTRRRRRRFRSPGRRRRP